MSETILDTMTEQYHSLTRAGKKLANYLFSNAGEAQYLSITSLAEKCGVSEASITRFCRALGLSGYNELKLALARTFRTNEFGDLMEKPEAIAPGDSFDTSCKKLYASYVTALNETMEQLDEGAFSRAADLLFRAENVYCIGQGSSMVIAAEAYTRFSTVTRKFVAVSNSHSQMITASLATEGDVILLFSYSGATREGLEVLQTAQERRVPVILVTHFSNSPAARYAQEILLCGYNENPLQAGSVATKMSQLYIIDCLYCLYCQRDPEGTAAARNAAVEALTRNHT